MSTNVGLNVDLDTVNNLIRMKLMDRVRYDEYLARTVGDGTNLDAVDHAVKFMDMYTMEGDSEHDVKKGHFPATVDVLCLAATIHPKHPKLIPLLLALGRDVAVEEEPDIKSMAPEFQIDPTVVERIQPFKKVTDPTDGLRDESKFLFSLWLDQFNAAKGPQDLTDAYESFVQKMLTTGDLLDSDENILLFFKVSMEITVQQGYEKLGDVNYSWEESCYSPDALTRFVSLLIRDVVYQERKENVMEKYVGVVTSVLKEDMEAKGGEFQSLPFLRSLMSLFRDMNDPIYENNSTRALMTFSSGLHRIRPTEASGFAFAWLSIVGHREFIGCMLNEGNRWWMYAQLWLDLFHFLAPFVQTSAVTRGILTLCRGTHRVLLLILHDFPDFLAEFALRFMDILPPTAVPLRNVIQSAIPRLFRPPYRHPYKDHLFDKLGCAPLTPLVRYEVTPMIRPKKFKKDLDFYLDTATPLDFLHELQYNFKLFEVDELGSHYNIPLLNAVVLYIATRGIDTIRHYEGRLTRQTVSETTHFDVYYKLCHDLDNEGLYLFSTSIVNHLRYPSTHTFYFGAVILELFRVATKPRIKEILARVFIERLLANRPWPWGLLVVLRELTENPAYNFWKQTFVAGIPQIKQFFENVKNETLGKGRKQEDGETNESDDDTLVDDASSWADDDTLTDPSQSPRELEQESAVENGQRVTRGSDKVADMENDQETSSSCEDGANETMNEEDADETMESDADQTMNKEEDAETMNEEDADEALKEEDADETLQQEDTLKEEDADDDETLKQEDAVETLKQEDDVEILKEEDAVETLKQEDDVEILKEEDAVKTLKEEDADDTMEEAEWTSRCRATTLRYPFVKHEGKKIIIPQLTFGLNTFQKL